MPYSHEDNWLLKDKLLDIEKKIDRIIETQEKQWELIHQHQRYWDGTFLIGKLFGMIGVIFLGLWGIFTDWWRFLSGK